MSQFTKENYIHIDGFMITELGLKGNELILYAIIYGYSQDGRSNFLGSINYIATALNCSRPTAISLTEKLIDKGLIAKSIGNYKGQECNQYEAILEGSKETLLVKKLNAGSKETLPNNNNINNIYTETEFLKRWKDARMYYDKMPTNITKLDYNDKGVFKELTKTYTSKDFDKAIQGLFEQKSYPQTRLKPSHFLKDFETYLTCGLTGEKLYEPNKRIYKHKDSKTGMI